MRKGANENDVFRAFSSLFFLFFFFCAAFFPFRRAKREIFVPPLRIFLSFFAFFDPNRRQGLEASGSRKKQKKRPRGRKKKKNSPAFLCVRARTSKMSKDFLDSLSCNKNYTNVIIKLSLTKKKFRERESVKPEAFM